MPEMHSANLLICLACVKRDTFSLEQHIWNRGMQDTSSSSPLIRLYYTSRIFMGYCCVSCEFLYLSIYAATQSDLFHLTVPGSASIGYALPSTLLSLQLLSSDKELLVSTVIMFLAMLGVAVKQVSIPPPCMLYLPCPQHPARWALIVCSVFVYVCTCPDLVQMPHSVVYSFPVETEARQSVVQYRYVFLNRTGRSPKKCSVYRGFRYTKSRNDINKEKKGKKGKKRKKKRKKKRNNRNNRKLKQKQ